MIKGVSPSVVYLPKMMDNPNTIFEFFCQKFSHISEDVWRQRFLSGQVLDECGQALSLDTPYRYGKNVYYYRWVDGEVVVPFSHKILYEDDEIIIVDKPHFLAVSPAGSHVSQTLLTRLKYETHNQNLSPIHRLDRQTAGLIMISKNPKTRDSYQALFRHNRITKVYHAIAPVSKNQAFPCELSLHLTRGEPFYTMRVTKGEPNSQTFIDLLDVQDNLAKYELRPTTGKLHQLRVHLTHLGLPILHDEFYPTVCHQPKDDFTKPLQLLAKSLQFIDPMTGRQQYFESTRTLLW
ncbi:pseudouridine synthase [Moraxella nasovis]|uniref:pseudouridine synthase n=1 Tax=Moraxella nasovis TaxID=2904121 RepID=UPI001F62453A|nr:pseudouridine synthase [Moraxella nasovis]UNU74293.1 pseudouridine synthase [Moraxella nasovis]